MSMNSMFKHNIDVLDLKLTKKNRPFLYADLIDEGLIAEDKDGNPVQVVPGQPWLRTYDAFERTQ